MDLEIWVRSFVFLAVLATMLAWETWRPFRRPVISRWRHRLNNLALVLIDTAVLRLCLPAAAVGAAAWADVHGIGLLRLTRLPVALEWAIAILALDFAIYLQHRLMHALPLLWRLHRVHHTALDFDTTTGVRFHPVEILVSMLLKMALVVLLGAPPGAVLVFEVLLSSAALFNHGNVTLPGWIESRVRSVLVTPDVHRIHHSVLRSEHDRNYGFLLVVWDRLLGTYAGAPRGGQAGFRIGLETPRDARAVDLSSLLWQPFGRTRRGL